MISPSTNTTSVTVASIIPSSFLSPVLVLTYASAVELPTYCPNQLHSTPLRWALCVSACWQACGGVFGQAAGELMRVSERRSPTFPRRLAVRRLWEGGSPLSHDLSGSSAHLGAIHFLPENSLSPATAGEGERGKRSANERKRAA